MGLRAPVNVTWEITLECNLRCVHCLSDSGKAASNELNQEECLRLIDELAHLRVFQVNIGGGEPFIRPGFLDLLKLRLSYGITGNDNIGNYTATKYYASQNLLGSEGLIKGNLYNPALKWETNRKLNGGLDLSLFGDRVFLRVDLYRNLTADLINVIDANPLSGFDNYVDNNGSFTSTGVDLSLDGVGNARRAAEDGRRLRPDLP